MSNEKKNKLIFIVSMSVLLSIGLYIAAFGKPSWMGKMKPYQVAVNKCSK